jgi:hypothetical protein
MSGKSQARRKAEEEAQEQGRDLQSSYSQSFNVRAYEYCLLGASNEELAGFFNVGLSSIQQWLVDRPTFRKAVAKGREAADAKVARSLYGRATGVTIKKERAVVVRGELKTLILKEELPADVNAAALWLSNRQRSKWRAANSGADPAAGFDLAGFVGALGAGIAKGLQSQAQQPGDAAEPIEPLDVVLEQGRKGE